MLQRLLFVCFAMAVLSSPGQVYAQFTDPRTYDNSPVGINQLELSYAYAHANASIDTSLIIAGAKFDLNQGTHRLHALFRLRSPFDVGERQCSTRQPRWLGHRE